MNKNLAVRFPGLVLNPRRKAPTLLALGTLLAFVGLAAGQGASAASASAKAMPDDFSGDWAHDMFGGINTGRATPDDPHFKMSDGTIIPLRPEAEALYRKRVAMNMTQHPFANTSSRCLPIGTPGNMMGAPYPVRIVQRPNFIAMLFEEGWQFRTIYMNSKHPDELVPSFMGHSIGHWEGKTLVIDTVSLREETTLNFSGLPHSEQLHVTERITRTGPTQLTDVIKIDDPVMYTKPFAFTAIFNKSDDELIEYICENSKVLVTPDGRQTYEDASDKN